MIEVQQFIRVLRSSEEPLLQILFDDRRTASFAVTVIAPDLFARQRGIAVRAPVHRGHLAISQPHLVQLDEEPFGPLVIFRVGRDGLTFPIEHRTHRLHLCAHAFDVLECALHRVNAVLDSRVFGGQAERIEAHREQYVIYPSSACNARVYPAGSSKTSDRCAGRRWDTAASSVHNAWACYDQSANDTAYPFPISPATSFQ